MAAWRVALGLDQEELAKAALALARTVSGCRGFTTGVEGDDDRRKWGERSVSVAVRADVGAVVGVVVGACASHITPRRNRHINALTCLPALIGALCLGARSSFYVKGHDGRACVPQMAGGSEARSDGSWAAPSDGGSVRSG